MKTSSPKVEVGAIQLLMEWMRSMVWVQFLDVDFENMGVYRAVQERKSRVVKFKSYVYQSIALLTSNRKYKKTGEI